MNIIVDFKLRKKIVPYPNDQLTGKTTGCGYGHGNGRSLAHGLEHVVEELLCGRLVEIESDLKIERDSLFHILLPLKLAN